MKDHENTEAAACTGSMPRSNIDWLKSWLEQEREKWRARNIKNRNAVGLSGKL